MPTLRLNRPSDGFSSTLFTAMSTFAGKTAAVSANRPNAEIRRVVGRIIPRPSAISAPPLTRLTNLGSGTQSGTIDSKKSGLAKCITPAVVKNAAARYGERRDMDPVKRERAPTGRSRGGGAYAGSVTDTAVNVEVLPSDWREQVLTLAKERDAVILAHNYQVPEIQDIAHHVGDSLGLSRVAAQVEESTIVFCGVHFMAESAKILAFDKTVLIPDAAAGCSLAESINAEQLRAWKAEHPGAVVVSYVNTTAEVKAETDICCTSSNAVEVVESIPRDQEILFCPDQFLGAHVQRMTGRDNMHIWLGECHVHAGINGADLRERVAAEPDAELFVHPECGCATSAMYLVGAGVVPETSARILSTGGMVDAARETTAAKVLVATETGMIHQLEKVNSTTEFIPVNRAAVCKYMKMITPAKLLRSLRDGTDEVFVDADIADRARLSVERMIAIGTPSATAE